MLPELAPWIELYSQMCGPITEKAGLGPILYSTYGVTEDELTVLNTIHAAAIEGQKIKSGGSLKSLAGE